MESPSYLAHFRPDLDHTLRSTTHYDPYYSYGVICLVPVQISPLFGAQYRDLDISPSWELLHHLKTILVTYMDASSPLSLVYVHPIHLRQDSHLLFQHQPFKIHQPITYQGPASSLLGLDRLCPQSTGDLIHHLINPKLPRTILRS